MFMTGTVTSGIARAFTSVPKKHGSTRSSILHTATFCNFDGIGAGVSVGVGGVGRVDSMGVASVCGVISTDGLGSVRRIGGVGGGVVGGFVGEAVGAKGGTPIPNKSGIHDDHVIRTLSSLMVTDRTLHSNPSSMAFLGHRNKSSGAAFRDQCEDEDEPASIVGRCGRGGHVERSRQEAWMVNLGRGDDEWLSGPRDVDWFTGIEPSACPGEYLMWENHDQSSLFSIL